VSGQRRPYAGARVVLGVTGGIASYKSAWLARLLSKAGVQVDVVMTAAAREFIGAILLAAKCPVLLVPAMNDQMWAHAQTQANVARLRELGYRVAEPSTGDLAAGEGSGPGRMPEPEVIFEHVGRVLEKSQSLAGTSVLVTAGPTREAVDPVRFISNRSSGKMGVAIAEAAWRRGADVTLVAGPLEVAVPASVRVRRVETTGEMSEAIGTLLPRQDVLVMAAAPADFRPTKASQDKIKRATGATTIDLESTTDILAATRAFRKQDATVVGFALETRELIANAEKKLAEKGLDLIVANDALEPGAGFGGDTNKVTFVYPNGSRESLAMMPKHAVADEILDRIERIRHGR
jgi:phosphopantothenoylcysteine decarboxylase/phosphopantothenate--cysteine ligase